jgi:hypothetical protein
MKIIKKYNQYIKKFNESIEDSMREEIENPEENYFLDEDEIENGIDSEDDETVDGENIISSDDIIDDEEPVMENEPEEEEGYQYIGSKMMKDLAKKLGEVVQNNKIVYNGKTIHFYSETEMYHVDGKKFKTSGEVVNYLDGDKVEDVESMTTPEISNISPESNLESKSYRYKRRNFKKS